MPVVAPETVLLTSALWWLRVLCFFFGSFSGVFDGATRSASSPSTVPVTPIAATADSTVSNSTNATLPAGFPPRPPACAFPLFFFCRCSATTAPFTADSRNALKFGDRIDGQTHETYTVRAVLSFSSSVRGNSPGSTGTTSVREGITLTGSPRSKDPSIVSASRTAFSSPNATNAVCVPPFEWPGLGSGSMRHSRTTPHV